jgi:hypothetical protein
MPKSGYGRITETGDAPAIPVSHHTARQQTGISILRPALMIIAPMIPNTSHASLESKHFWGFIVLVAVVIGFGVVLFVAGERLGNVVGPRLHELEMSTSAWKR